MGESFNAWYRSWIPTQELTISRQDVAAAAFEAGIKCAERRILDDSDDICFTKGDFGPTTHKEE